MIWPTQLQDWLDRFLMPIDDAGSRLFHLNLLLALGLVVVWLFYAEGFRNPWPSLRRLVFRKKYWWNRSTKLDYKIYLLNSVLKVLLFIPFLDFSFAIARGTSKALLTWNGDFGGLQATTFNMLLFTLGVFVWDDFLRFFHHFLMHKIPWLWRLHKTHHSARVLTPITLYRTHPLESALATVRNSISLGIAAGVFVFLFEAQFNLLTLFGVNAFGFLFNFLGANLRHSHIPITFGPGLERVFISPKQHQIHHSSRVEHYDKNFGVSLAVWDKVFGTLIASREVGPASYGTLASRLAKRDS